MVLYKLREVTKPKRNLDGGVWPVRVLGLILKSGNVFCRQVILALVKTDRRSRF